MNLLPVVKQQFAETELKTEINETVEDETDEQSEEEQEEIINIKPRKKANRNEIFDIQTFEPEPEPDPVTEEENPNFIYEEEVKPIETELEKPKKRPHAKRFEEGHTIGDYHVIVDKNGDKRWASKKNQQKAKERMLAMHRDGKIGTNTKKGHEKRRVEKKVVDEEAERIKLVKQYQDQMALAIKQASLEAVEEYDTRRKARKAKKKIEQDAQTVNNQLHNKLSNLAKPKPKYGEVGFFNQCWD
tara:strand:+ start:743 stop:1474 length:732 start_codon:yes stop_codon:yes gene_type:complete